MPCVVQQFNMSCMVKCVIHVTFDIHFYVLIRYSHLCEIDDMPYACVKVYAIHAIDWAASHNRGVNMLVMVFALKSNSTTCQLHISISAIFKINLTIYLRYVIITHTSDHIFKSVLNWLISNNQRCTISTETTFLQVGRLNQNT